MATPNGSQSDGQAEKPLDRMRRREEAFEGYFRIFVTGVLVVGTIGAVFFGIWRDVKPADLSQYLAPVTGLAGIAVGYFFGKVAGAPNR